MDYVFDYYRILEDYIGLKKVINGCFIDRLTIDTFKMLTGDLEKDRVVLSKLDQKEFTFRKHGFYYFKEFYTHVKFKHLAHEYQIGRASCRERV